MDGLLFELWREPRKLPFENYMHVLPPKLYTAFGKYLLGGRCEQRGYGRQMSVSTF